VLVVFLVLFEKILRPFLSQEDRCVSRRLRSLPRGSRFLRSENYSFPKPGSLRFSCFVTRLALRFHFFEWLPKLLGFESSARSDLALSSQDFRLREGSRLFCSSSREGDANAAIRNQVPEIRGSCFRAFFESSVLPPITRKNMCHFTRRSFEKQNPCGVPSSCHAELSLRPRDV